MNQSLSEVYINIENAQSHKYNHSNTHDTEIMH